MLQLLKQDNGSKARLGKLTTNHGVVETPFFMPACTKGCVKFMSSQDLVASGTEAIITNAFILSLQPGLDLIKKHGTLHDFMQFHKTIFTDSGGFQMLREAFLLKYDREGIWFKSPFDGKKHHFTPAKAMDTELAIGSDVAMVLDNVAPYGSTQLVYREAMELTHHWVAACKKHHAQYNQQKQLLFGICQGGFIPALREESAKHINQLDFDGNAIGGLCIGEPKPEMYQMIDASIGFLDEKKPRYLMGVGSPEDLVECVARGVDIFDSVFPTQNARHNTLFTSQGKLRIDRAEYKDDTRPIDPSCTCYVCKHFSRAYVRYLSKIDEPTAKIYKTYHNIYYLQHLIRQMREAIAKGTFVDLRVEINERYGSILYPKI
ncbi:tRNA guanosine(34) transglycosylase Tgt [Candidatus Woesearchaeota archaeon]|nr:tRNA guanosine(34) transglycosylase Tgt [Candidatus Woesearchaeota archaeon]